MSFSSTLGGLTMAAAILGAPTAGWAQAGAATPAPLSADQVQWDQQAMGSDLADLFPAAALEANKGGTASILCSVTDDGTLANCTVQSETPPGLGFGAASILAAKLYKLHLTDAVRATLKKSGATVVIPIDWASPLA